jgi:hypothetical protein
MSLSTLPDLFKNNSVVPIKFHKQGGQFSLHLFSSPSV